MDLTQADFSPGNGGRYLLRRLMDTTAPAGETADDAGLRRAAIQEMFLAFAPANAKQAMLACDCIALEFVLNGAMRDAGDLRLEPKLLARARSSAASLSRTLLQWVARYERVQTRDLAEASAPPSKTVGPAAASARPAPDPLLAKAVRTSAPAAALFRMAKTGPQAPVASGPLGRSGLAASPSFAAMLAPATVPAATAHAGGPTVPPRM